MKPSDHWVNAWIEAKRRYDEMVTALPHWVKQVIPAEVPSGE